MLHLVRHKIVIVIKVLLVRLFIHVLSTGIWVLRSFYDEGSIMLSDDVSMLADLLLGLNVLDFRYSCIYVAQYNLSGAVFT